MGGSSNDKSPFWKNPIATTIQAVQKSAEAIVKNPLPVIETIALTYALGPAGAGFGAATAASVSSAAVTAANGGDVNDVATAAAAGYVGGTASEAAGAGASDAGASASTAKIASSAAGASSSTVTAQLAKGKSLDEALQAGLTSGALAAGTTSIVEAGKEAVSDPATGASMKAEASTVPPEQAAGDYSVKADYSLPSQQPASTGITEKIPTGGGQGLVVDSNAILPASLAASQYAPPSEKVRGTETGGTQPAYSTLSQTLTPSTFDSSITGETSYKEPATLQATSQPTVPLYAEIAGEVARPIIRQTLSDVLGLGSKVPGAPAAGSAGQIAQGASTGTTTSLTGERGAGEIESKETGKDREDVWNESSLRLKDALGV